MNISGTYTTADLISATWIHLRPRRSLGILGVVVILLSLVAVYLAFFGQYSAHPGWSRWILVAALLYLALALGLGIPYRSHRTYQQRKDLQRPCSFSPSDSGLLFSTEGASGTKPWSDYLKWKEGRDTILLYMSDNLYQMIPKRFFASEKDLEMFRELLHQKFQRHVA
jgi:hypothetical protein